MEQKKHDHKDTNKLKVKIFTLLCLLPFIIGLLVFVYETFNKNAEYNTNIITSIDTKVWGSTLFSWYSETPLAESIQAFLTMLGIPNGTTISNSLIYILTITIIYIILDIVIETFKFLTHLITNRTL